MGEVSTIGLDLAKSVFQVHGADASGAVLFRKKLRRHQVLTFFAGQPPCTVAMEACGSAHHWARENGRLGRAVRLIPPAYVNQDKRKLCEAHLIGHLNAHDLAARRTVGVLSRMRHTAGKI
jgi:transposase